MRGLLTPLSRLVKPAVTSSGFGVRPPKAPTRKLSIAEDLLTKIPIKTLVFRRPTQVRRRFIGQAIQSRSWVLRFVKKPTEWRSTQSMQVNPIAILLRNILFLFVVLCHGFRRIAPPY